MAERSGRYGSSDRNSAIRRASAKNRRRRKRRALGNLIGLLAIVIIVGSPLVYGILKSRSELSQLKAKEAKLMEEKEEQLTLKQELEERAVYVNTKAYVEDMAKKLGLVYPNEVVFKPEE